MIRRITQLGLIGAILGGTVFLVFLLVKGRPTPPMEEPERVLPVVEVMEVSKETIALTLPSQGMVEPDRITSMAAEVSGTIISVSPKFETGREFEKGEVLVEIDSSDYEAALAQAEANLEEARLTLSTEEAQSEKALRDWEELNLSGKPSDLTLRKPQLASARARVAALEASLEKARRDLERTKIRAPYPARLEMIHTHLGTYVSPGEPIVDLHSLAPYEVRLPLSLDDYVFVGGTEEEHPAVRLVVRIGKHLHEWDGNVVRQEGQVNRDSRSVYLVAEVSPQKDAAIMQPGLFVQAEIEGKDLEDVARIPLAAFYDLERVVILDQDNRLKFREVEVLRRQGNIALVGDGLQDGERICLTALDAVVEGMEVQVRTEGSLEDAAPAVTDASTTQPET